MSLSLSFWISATEEPPGFRKDAFQRLGDPNNALHRKIEALEARGWEAAGLAVLASHEGRHMKTEYWMLYSAMFPDSECLFPNEYAAARA